MRTNTRKIFEILSRGAFITIDSSETKILFQDLEDNFEEYKSYYSEIGFNLEGGDGYFFFSRIGEAKVSIEQKINTFAQWIDILDFLKSYDVTFSTGYQFRASQIVERINIDYELMEKSRKIYTKIMNYEDFTQKIISDLNSLGYIEIINDQDLTYKVTSAFNYLENLVNLIILYNEEDFTDNEIS